MKNKKEMKHKREDHTGLFIPAGIFVGLGVGGLYDNWGVGVLVGLGVGFLLMAIFRLLRK